MVASGREVDENDVKSPTVIHFKGNQMPKDWKEISNEKEKYQAYLCSREWSEKRESVRDRASNKCERCKIFPMDACHHLTYARKYNEELEDLQAICNNCHKFTHGKSDYDPILDRDWVLYAIECRKCSVSPIPVEQAMLARRVNPAVMDSELAAAYSVVCEMGSIESLYYESGDDDAAGFIEQWMQDLCRSSETVCSVYLWCCAGMPAPQE